jgi:hypothetical protein
VLALLGQDLSFDRLADLRVGGVGRPLVDLALEFLE